MKFTILHPTARVTPGPNSWHRAATCAFENCQNPQDVQYILVVHHSRIADFWGATYEIPFFGEFAVITNYGRDCLVDQCNAGMAAVRGEILMGNQDDMRYPRGWDTEILTLIPDTSKSVCVKAHTDGARPDLLTIPTIITRPLFLAHGLISPEYESMFSDDESSLRFKQLGEVIQAPHLYFRHLHPVNGLGEWDEVYQQENREKSYAKGLEVFRRRKAAGFPRVPFPFEGRRLVVPSPHATEGQRTTSLASEASPPVRHFIACLPGEDYDRIKAVLDVQAAAFALNYNFLPILGYTSSPDITRCALSEEALDQIRQKNIPYVYWQDDDNIVTPDQLLRLIQFLDSHPEADVVVGWCWIRRGDNWTPSLGRFQEDLQVAWMTIRELSEQCGDFLLVDGMASGFPCVLMRSSVLDKLGANCFTKVPCPASRYGYLGEDFSFFYRAMKAGMRCYVDPNCKVLHIKPEPQEPDLLIPPDAKVAPELRAWMERVNGKPVEIGAAAPAEKAPESGVLQRIARKLGVS